VVYWKNGNRGGPGCSSEDKPKHDGSAYTDWHSHKRGNRIHVLQAFYSVPLTMRISCGELFAVGSKPRLASPFLWINKSQELAHCLIQYFIWHPANALGFPCSPVEASQLVREYDPPHL
jgi:hypothetical protein